MGEVGKLVFGHSSVNEVPRVIALVFSVLTLCNFFFNIYQSQMLLSTALGLAVSEREWLAIDCMDKISDRKNMRAQATDEQGNKLNLTYFWLCLSACAKCWGAGIISRLGSNCALMTKIMMEEGTPFEFIGFPKAKLNLLIWPMMINGFQVGLLTCMSVLYFGTYAIGLDHDLFWSAFVLLICTLGSILRLREIMQLFLADSAPTYRQTMWVGWIIVAFCVVMLVVTTCLIPIMIGNGNLLGSCEDSPVYRELFPQLCLHEGQENVAAYWVVMGSVSVMIGLTIGIFIFGTPGIILK